MEYLVDVAFADEQLIAGNDQAERIAKAVPGSQLFAAGIEHLNPLVAAIADENAVLLVDCQVVRRGELADFFPLLAPFQKVRAINGELGDPAVAAVSDVKIAARVE